MHSDQSIGEYYERIRLERDAAWQKVRDARARNAPREEIQELEEKALEAGYTGD